MITGALGVRAANVNLVTAGIQDEKVSAPTANPKQRSDYYVSGVGEYKVKPETKKLTPEMAADLAKKYDVKNMTRDEYGSLLKDLRDSGVISSKDFSVGFGGAVPYGGPSGLTIGATDDPSLDSWPVGKEKTDFTRLLRSCAQYCKNFSYSKDDDGKGEEICKSLSNSYDRLLEIFNQIEKASKQIH